MAVQLVFISGVGDRRHGFYDKVAKHWRVFELYQAHAYVFGWDDPTTNFPAKFTKLLEFIDTFKNDTVYLVGVSAGGTAALNALAVRPNIAKVALISSPFQVMHYTNPALLESIERAQKSFATFDEATKRKLLVITGLHDRVVPTQISALDGVERAHIVAFTHIGSVVMATLFQTRPLRRFLKR